MSTKRSWNLSMYDPGLYIWDGQYIIFLLIFTLSLPFQLSKIERLSQKLHIMSFIGNFNENVHHLAPVSHPKDKLQSTSTFVIFCFIVINRCLFPVMMQQTCFVILWTCLHHIPVKWYWIFFIIDSHAFKKYKNVILYFLHKKFQQSLNGDADKF